MSEPQWTDGVELPAQKRFCTGARWAQHCYDLEFDVWSRFGPVTLSEAKSLIAAIWRINFRRGTKAQPAWRMVTRRYTEPNGELYVYVCKVRK